MRAALSASPQAGRGAFTTKACEALLLALESWVSTRTMVARGIYLAIRNERSADLHAALATRVDELVEYGWEPKERGFLAVMWPKLLAFLVFLVAWIALVRWYF